jgi:hypothetical protein
VSFSPLGHNIKRRKGQRGKHNYMYVFPPAFNATNGASGRVLKMAVVLFNDTVSNSKYLAPDDGMINEQ